MQSLTVLAMVFTLALSILQCGKAESKTDLDIAKTNTNSLEEPAQKDDAPRISLEDAKKAFDAGKVLFIDTRGEAQYKQEHIKGAINIPEDAFQTRYTEVPKDKKIIAYCS